MTQRWQIDPPPLIPALSAPCQSTYERVGSCRLVFVVFVVVVVVVGVVDIYVDFVVVVSVVVVVCVVFVLQVMLPLAHTTYPGSGSIWRKGE